jgi:DNA polymerase
LEPAQGPASLDLAKVATLEDLAEFSQSCGACPARQLTKIIGQGPLNPTFMLVLDPSEDIKDVKGVKAAKAAKAPGAAETAWPAGEAGRLLSELVEQSLGLEAEAVYATWAYKCRLNSEKPPQAAKTECLKILLKEIELVKPRVVLALGVAAGQLLAHSDKQMFILRQKKHFIKGPAGDTPLKVTLGLSMILEDPLALKKGVEDDFLAAKSLATPDSPGSPN